MIVPILTVVLDQLYTDKGPTREKIMFYLAVGYCANIGGTGTVTAEETNLILMVPIVDISLCLHHIFVTGNPGNLPLRAA